MALTSWNCTRSTKFYSKTKKFCYTLLTTCTAANIAMGQIPSKSKLCLLKSLVHTGQLNEVPKLKMILFSAYFSHLLDLVDKATKTTFIYFCPHR